MIIETSKDAARFFRLVIQYVCYVEELMARAPKDTTLKEWDKHERAAAERRVSDEGGLSLEQLETIKQWDLRAMAKRAFSLFEVPADTMGFIQARSRTTIGSELASSHGSRPSWASAAIMPLSDSVPFLPNGSKKEAIEIRAQRR
jgi:hypothetical protein